MSHILIDCDEFHYFRETAPLVAAFFMYYRKTLIEQSIFEGSTRREAMKKTIKNGLSLRDECAMCL